MLANKLALPLAIVSPSSLLKYAWKLELLFKMLQASGHYVPRRFGREPLLSDNARSRRRGAREGLEIEKDFQL